ncbi:MAG: lamin tail domain-containing protein, partial [Treponema sp.]|nr:lamin tail domain-containing protein [Treponema sp.]
MVKRQFGMAVGIFALLVAMCFLSCPDGNEDRKKGNSIEAGAPDELAGELLILQAYGATAGAAGASHPFVELYNTTNAPINLSGITLYYANGIRGAVTLDGPWKMIPLTGTIPAKGSFLVLGPRISTDSRLQIANGYGDINDNNFVLNHRSYKIAIIRNTLPLDADNPFNMNGSGAKAAGYIDMVGAVYPPGGNDNIFGYETAPVLFSVSEAIRRKNLNDTNNNAGDFMAMQYAAGGLSDEEVAERKPRNASVGAWDPFPESSGGPTVAGPPSPFAGSLLIFQVGAATDGAITRSFVELYNNTDNPINLSTYSLQYGNAVGTDWTIINLTGTIPAKGSYLVRGPLGTITSDSRLYIDVADQTIDDFVLSNRNYKVALMANQQQLTVANPFVMTGGTAAGYVDLVGARNGAS